MKRIAVLSGTVLIALLLSFLSAGCAEYKLQQAEVSGPAIRNTIRITENRKEISIEARGAVSRSKGRTLKTNTGGHSKVDAYGVYRVTPVQGEEYFKEDASLNTNEFGGDNLVWHIPDTHMYADLDIGLKGRVALTAGVTYAELQGQDFWGSSFGVGFFKEYEKSAIRFDVIYKMQELAYSAEFIKTEGDPFRDKRVWFFDHSSKETQGSLLFSLTGNSKNPEKPFNLFYNIALGYQTLFDFDPDFTVADLSHTTFVYTGTLGLYKSIPGFGRAVTGIRITKYNDSHSMFIPDFFLQFDLTLL